MSSAIWGGESFVDIWGGGVVVLGLGLGLGLGVRG